MANPTQSLLDIQLLRVAVVVKLTPLVMERRGVAQVRLDTQRQQLALALLL
jgi:hypothetical protein